MSAISTYQQNHHTARLFCSHCGSNLVSTHILTDDTVYVSLGSLDDTKGINIEYQQFTESKAGWVNIDSGVAAHDEWPELIKARAKELAASRNNKNQA